MRRILFFALLVIALPSPFCRGQAARSPFASFGLGEQFGYALVQSQGMGGVGISNPEFWYINNQNPALLVFNRFVTFQAAIVGEQRYQTTDAQTGRSGSGNLNYLVLGIPIKPGKWTSTLSLMPYTRLNYQYKHTESIEGDPNNVVNVSESGSGGINQFSWSNGVAINRQLSVGLRASYLFSSITYEYSAVFNQTNQPVVLYPLIVDRTFVSDFQFAPGISLHLDSLLNKDYRLNVGLVYEFGTNLNAKFNQRLERWGPSGRIDSLTLINNHPGTITVPSTIGLGVSFGNSYKWVAALDGVYSNYSSYKDLTGNNPYGSNYWRVSAGFQFSPDPTSLTNYLKRMTYRTGVSMENFAYLVNGNPVKDFGITFGLSLPVGRLSTLDLGLKMGRKGDKALNTIEENYIKFYFGMTLNDQWFIKRRFD